MQNDGSFRATATLALCSPLRFASLTPTCHIVELVGGDLRQISYAGYRFPPVIIQQAVWLYARFTLSFRDVEDLLAERGIMVSYETVRRWVKYFGSMIAADLRRRRPKPHSTWHLDEGFIKIDGRLVYLWRAVDAEGEVLDVLVQSKRDKRAALKDLIIGCRYRIGGCSVPPVPHFPPTEGTMSDAVTRTKSGQFAKGWSVAARQRAA